LDVALDTLGSIQNPAHYCGVCGMRPTEHRVPLTGAFFLDPVRKFRVMSVVGPMARSVEDLRLALRLLAGPDGHDSHVPPVPWREPEPLAGRGLRIAWSPEIPGTNIQDEISAAVEEAARGLASRGATVEEHLPGVDPRQQYELADELFFGLLAGTFAEEPTAFSEETGADSEGERHNPSKIGMPSSYRPAHTRPNSTERNLMIRRTSTPTPSPKSRAVRWLWSRRESTAGDCLSGCRCWAAAGTTSGC
jgi:Asp-tRNA(Asn)/Glu-tRNA(Gln) amidotransferase A subunit family amidase